MSTLSVIVIVKNEARRVRACLESVRWANEIIVLDSGSTDATVAICREYTPHVWVTDWPGFGPQKIRAQNLATQDWILCIDADERVTPALAALIPAAIQSSKYDAYQIPFQSTYCGKLIKHGPWRHDRAVVLFRRGRASFTPCRVHEKVTVSGKVGKLCEPILHETSLNLEQVIEKINFYSTETAKVHHQSGRHGSLLRAIASSFWCFVRFYFLQLGLLDGREGFMLAVSSAESTYYRYLKLMYLERK